MFSCNKQELPYSCTDIQYMPTTFNMPFYPINAVSKPCQIKSLLTTKISTGTVPLFFGKIFPACVLMNNSIFLLSHSMHFIGSRILTVLHGLLMPQQL